MKTVNLYHRMWASLKSSYNDYELFDTNEDLRPLSEAARSWGMDQTSIREWLLSSVGQKQRTTAEAYLAVAEETVKTVEQAFGRELPGVLLFLPSFGEFDGFARYELGEHRVLLGIDYPDADVDYLRALTAHELSHVFRDHSPDVWGHLGKPLSQITRSEYLDASSAQEHLVSEGLATLFSQALFPEIPRATHHYYHGPEWEWCVQNDAQIERAFVECLRGDEDVWSFYSPGRAGRGSPSRTQYYWAAKKLGERFGPAGTPPKSDWLREIVALHEKPADGFPEFQPR